MDYNIQWSEESINNLEEILEYLTSKWTQREVDNFKTKLSRQLELIRNNPLMFPISEYNKKLRKGVLSRQTTIFYKVQENTVFIVYLFVNKKDIKNIED